MKKIVLFLALMTTLLSCSLDEPDRYTYYVLPIDSYTLPETFKVNQTHEVKLKYQKPTACYEYGGIYYYSEGNERTIGINASVKQGAVCSTELPPLTEVSFNFAPATAGTYVFKFYKGDDDAGENIFEEVEIVVTE
ncbi:MAG TPA: hypothetical protein VJ780_10975 [Flavobacterium sp.]|nr:hypothetical protein [Flavobacterium sp.]